MAPTPIEDKNSREGNEVVRIRKTGRGRGVLRIRMAGRGMRMKKNGREGDEIAKV